MIRTQIAAAAIAVFDTLFFRRKFKKRARFWEYQADQLGFMWKKAEAKLEAQAKDEESARAQLCQLRVVPETFQGRTGFAVSAFVPTDVLIRLNAASPQARNNFQMRVTKVLVDHALRGLYRVTARGTMVAMVFEPLGLASRKRIVSPVFETADGKNQIVHPPANSLDVRMIQEAQQRGDA